MDIYSKYSLKSKIYHESKYFTNRELQRKYFHKKTKYLVSKDNFKEVLVFHGVGGIGKSELLNQLKKEVKEKEESFIISEIDFQNPQLNNPSKALFEIRRNMFNKKITFPHFDLAYFILFSKKNPEFVYNHKKLISEEVSLFGKIVGVLDGLGFTGSLIDIVNFVYAKAKKLNLDDKIKTALNELTKLQVYEIEERLPAFLGYDIDKAKKKKQLESFICFFDTYESIYSDATFQESKLFKDNWVRELITNLESGLFIFSSREKLLWSKEILNWHKYIKHILIDDFTPKDAEDYLINCNIESSQIRNRMLQATSGHPYYLDLCIDTYYQLKDSNKEPSIDDFAVRKNEIFQIFYQNLKKDEADIFKVLSITRFYNEDIFFFLIKNLSTSYPISLFDELNRFSFIKKKKKNFFMHELVKESLSSTTSLKVKNLVNNLLLRYYEIELEKSIEIELFDNVESSFQESVYHAVNGCTKAELINWLESKKRVFKNLQYYGSAKKLINIFNQVSKKIKMASLPFELFSVYADMIHLEGSFKRAVCLIETYVKKNEKVIDTSLLLHFKIRLIHHKMFYINVNRLKNEILKLLQLTDIDSNPKGYNELLFMLGGNLGLLSGNFIEANHYIIKSIKVADSFNLTDFKCRSLRKFADILRVKKHLLFSVKFAKVGIKIAESYNYYRYKIYLQCTLADNYRMLNQITKSIECFEEAKRAAKMKGINSWVAHSMLGITMCYIKIGNIRKAVSLVNNAELIYKKTDLKWGIVNTMIIKYLLNVINEDELKKNKGLASRLGYKYETGIINKILQKDFRLSDYHLLFL